MHAVQRDVEEAPDADAQVAQEGEGPEVRLQMEQAGFGNCWGVDAEGAELRLQRGAVEDVADDAALEGLASVELQH